MSRKLDLRHYPFDRQSITIDYAPGYLYSDFNIYEYVEPTST